MKPFKTLILCTLLAFLTMPKANAQATFNLETGTGTGTGYTWSNPILTINNGATITITGTVSDGRRIEVAANASVNITLDNVSITGLADNQSPLLLNDGATVALTIEGVNTLTAGNNCAGIQAPDGTTLTIGGTGFLTATGGNFGAGIGGGKSLVEVATPCDAGTFDFGTVSFATATTWTVGSQTWSDAVTATNCQKTVFDGGVYEDHYNVDCRSNPGQKGDLFSWCAVARFKETLCSGGWRVPTRQDFIDLDIALGGDGGIRYPDMTTLAKYMGSFWGGSYGGYCYSDGTLNYQGWYANYWSQSENSATNGFNLNFNSSNVNPQNYNNKNNGFALRCVR